MVETSKTKQKGLGRGLSALFETEQDDYDAVATPVGAKHIKISNLQPGVYQPRRHFDEEAMAALAASIQQNGVLQPLLVRPLAEGRYEIIAGERRWRAAKQAGLEEVPAVVKQLSDKQALEVAIVENVQRDDLKPLEEANGYRQLIEEFHYRQEDLSKVIGKSRSHIANMMRLLKLPEAVKQQLDAGTLSMGHARVLIGSDDPERYARNVVTQNLSVRETEELITGSYRHNTLKRRAPVAKKYLDAERAQIHAECINVLRTVFHNHSIDIQATKQGGKLSLMFADDTELKAITELMRSRLKR